MKPLLTIIAASALLASLVSAQTCPSYTHKDDVVFDTTSTAILPGGWFVYVVAGQNGLYKSDLKTFNGAVLNNTSGDAPTYIDISDDGNWICYWSNNAIVLVKADGSVRRTITPQYDGATLEPFGVGFYHGSPKGTEIFYTEYNWSANQGQLPAGSQYSAVWAVQVNLATATPTVGTFRKIAILARAGNTGIRLNPFEGRLLVVKDQIFGLVNYSGGYRNGFLQIPDNGNGIADTSDLYVFAEGNDATNYWGCGEAMSWDGLYCASNSGLIGSSCLPSKNATVTIGTTTYPMDHKGFYITKFLRRGVDPVIHIDDQIDSAPYGISINWCPAPYRFNTYDRVDFNNWYFSNNNRYVIGSLKGSSAPIKGLWAINWETSRWTLVTPKGTATTYDNPAMWINSTAAINDNRHGAPSPMRKTPQAFKPALSIPAGASAYTLTGARFTVRKNQAVKGLAITSR